MKRTRRFTLPRYIGRRINNLQAHEEEFDRPESYSYAKTLLIRMTTAKAKLPQTNNEKRQFLHNTMWALLHFKPASHEEFLSRLRNHIETASDRQGRRGATVLTQLSHLRNLVAYYTEQDHQRQLKREPQKITWLEEPLDFRLLPDQLVTRFHKTQLRNASKPQASARTKDGLLRVLGRVIARNGVQALKQKSPNLSDRKLSRFEKELAAIEYNNLLFMGRDKMERRRGFSIIQPWEQVAHGHLVAEYGLHASTTYSQAASKARQLINTGLVRAESKSPGFAKMMRQQVPLPQLGFPWINLNRLIHTRELYDARMWGESAGLTERLPFVLDWEHFNMKHPHRRIIEKAERRYDRQQRQRE